MEHFTLDTGIGNWDLEDLTGGNPTLILPGNHLASAGSSHRSNAVTAGPKDQVVRMRLVPSGRRVARTRAMESWGGMFGGALGLVILGSRREWSNGADRDVRASIAYPCALDRQRLHVFVHSP